jgi:hypothetical protein
MMNTKQLSVFCGWIAILLMCTSVPFAETDDAEVAASASVEAADSSGGEGTQNGEQDVFLGLAPSHFNGGFVGGGIVYNNLTGSQIVISKYEPAKQGVRGTGRVGLWGLKNGLAYDLYGQIMQEASDQTYHLSTDLKRYWKSRLDIIKLPQRLVNDPLTNLDAAKGGPMVRHTSTDSDILYCPVYRDLRWTNRVTLPSVPLLSLHFDYRNQSRKGSYQARTTNKCATCHVVSSVREMDREMEEFRMGLEFGNTTAKVEYEFLNRDLMEKAGTPTLIYDQVQHPVFETRVFTNRAQFEESDGPLPFNHIPRFKKNRHLIRGRVKIPDKGGEVVGTYLNSRDHNSDQGYGVKSQVASGRYSVALGDRFRLGLVARNLDIESDSFSVDVNERPADFGPQVGKTYPEVYPTYGEADYLAHSHIAREKFDFKIDGRMLLPARSVFRIGYEYENLERPYFDVERTKTNRFKLGFNTSSSEDLKARLRYVYSNSDNPFAHLHAALPPALQLDPSPGDPPSPLKGTQYYEVYRARQVNLSSFPKNSHEFAGSATWAPNAQFALTGHLRAESHKNDELNDLSDWSDSQLSPSVQVWFAPEERVDFVVNYSYQRRKTESLFGIAVYDG